MLSDQRVFEAAAFVGDWWQLARLVWSALGHNYLIRVGVYHQVSVVRHDNDLAPLLRVAEICVCGD